MSQVSFFRRFEQYPFQVWVLVMALALGLTAVFYNIPFLSGPRWAREVFVWPLTAVLVFTYWQGFLALQRQSVSLKTLWMTGLLLALLAWAIPPFHSTDLFGYINRGWQQWHYSLNPYVYTVDHIPHWEQDPMITDHWVNNPSPYGFLYLLLAKALCALGAGHKALTVFVFKAFNVLIVGLTGLLIVAGVNALNRTREASAQPTALRAPQALYLYLWNPLVLIHAISNGHNDSVMGFFVTLAALLAIAGQWLWILPALMAATLIKYGAVVILPLAVLFLLKNRAWWALGGGLLLAALLFGLTGLPYLPDWQQFHLTEINRNAFVSHGSLHSFVYALFKNLDKTLLPGLHAHRETIRAILKNALLGAYALFVAGLFWRRVRQADYPPRVWIRDALLAMAVLIGLVSLKFYPWYLGMFFPLVLYLSPADGLQRLLIWVSCTQMLSITFIGQAHLLNFVLMTGLPIFYWWRPQKKATISEQEPSAMDTEGPVAE
ncbi:hypothetical protein [Vampirovibrio chlorellavorus]|uniref:hypothetical protein n=1 Tax=Vampirovibrio chlorellavorus TaxID=758823 RepID=UPI0026E9BCF1|nr:hypothetical protein [Vampirovibrio chlorellavorus]